MSMNLTMMFKDSKGRMVRHVDLQQTPTNDSYRLLDADNTLEAYLEWYAERATKYEWDKVEPGMMVELATADGLDTYDMELAYGEDAVEGDFQYVELPPEGGAAAEERRRLEKEIEEWGDDYTLTFEVW